MTIIDPSIGPIADIIRGMTAEYINDYSMDLSCTLAHKENNKMRWMDGDITERYCLKHSHAFRRAGILDF